MNYKNAICVCAVTMCISSAWGEEIASVEQGPSMVTFYGSIDEGVQYLSHAAVGKKTKSAVQVGAGMATSYFGFRGTEDLGQGMHAIFDLEAGYSANSGVSGQGGRFFGRQSYVGLDGRYGRLTFGRQYTMRFYATQAVNPFGDGAEGLTTLDNGIANARADDAISYRITLFGGLEAGVNYSFGRDAVAGNTQVATNCPGQTTPYQECKEWSTLLKYTGKSWGLATSYERDNGGTSATYGGLTSPNLTDSRFIAGAYVNISTARLGAGWIKRTDLGISTPRSNLLWVTGTVFVKPDVSIDAMVAQLKYQDSPNKALVLVLRTTYVFSKRTVVYLTGEHIQNGGNLNLAASTMLTVAGPPAGGAQVAVIAGIRHRF